MGARVLARIIQASGLIAWAVTAHAQAVFPPPSEPQRLSATRTGQPIRVDGVLDEAAWAAAAVADGFVQAEPVQGQPATEPTEARVLFDDRYLYVGLTCFDSHGAADLRVRDLRRDFDETTDDYVGVAIEGCATAAARWSSV